MFKCHVAVLTFWSRQRLSSDERVLRQFELLGWHFSSLQSLMSVL